jgi:hypothetical protein
MSSPAMRRCAVIAECAGEGTLLSRAAVALHNLHDGSAAIRAFREREAAAIVENDYQLHNEPMPLVRRSRAVLIVAALLAAGIPAAAQDAKPTLTIQNRQFVPAEITIPAGQKVELIIRNQQQTPAEFESTSLHREKVVPPGGEISVFVGPLEAGRYEFFDDFNRAARGFVVVK